MVDSKNGKKNIFYGKESIQAFRKNRQIAASLEEYHAKVRQLKEKLNIFREMHLQYCCHMMQKMFCMMGDKVCVNGNLEGLLKSKITNYDMFVFLLKLGCLMNCVSVLGKVKLCNFLVYDAKLCWNKSCFNVLMRKLLLRIDKSQFNTSIIFYCLSKVLKEDEKAVYRGSFYRRVLSLLCQLVKLRLCDPQCAEQHDVLEMGIISCAVMMGTMYKQYINIIRASGDIKYSTGFKQVVAGMGQQKYHRGAFAELCATILSKVSSMNDARCNKAVLFHGLHMPGGIITNASEHFLGRITQCIDNNVMFFNVIIEDLAMQICTMLDKMHLAAMQEEIEAYCAAYSKIIRGSRGQGGEGPSR